MKRLIKEVENHVTGVKFCLTNGEKVVDKYSFCGINCGERSKFWTKYNYSDVNWYSIENSLDTQEKLYTRVTNP